MNIMKNRFKVVFIVNNVRFGLANRVIYHKVNTENEWNVCNDNYNPCPKMLFSSVTLSTCLSITRYANWWYTWLPYNNRIICEVLWKWFCSRSYLFSCKNLTASSLQHRKSLVYEWLYNKIFYTIHSITISRKISSSNNIDYFPCFLFPF